MKEEQTPQPREQNTSILQQQYEQEQEEKIKKEKKDKLTKFMLYLSIFYMILLVILSFYIMFNEKAQLWVLNYFNSVNSGDMEDLFWLCFIGIVIILIGFPLTFYQIAFGYIIKQFWYALFLISIIKIIGFVLAFLIAKTFFRKNIEDLMIGNIYFDSFSKLVKDKPMTMITLLKLMHIPSVVKNYGVGVLQVTFCDFFWPTVWTSPVLASIWINVGVQLNSIYDITKSDDQPTSKEEMYWRIGMIVLTIIVFIYLTYLTKKVYDDMIQQAEKMDKNNNEQNQYEQINQDDDQKYDIDNNRELGLDEQK